MWREYIVNKTKKQIIHFNPEAEEEYDPISLLRTVLGSWKRTDNIVYEDYEDIDDEKYQDYVFLDTTSLTLPKKVKPPSPLKKKRTDRRLELPSYKEKGSPLSQYKLVVEKKPKKPRKAKPKKIGYFNPEAEVKYLPMENHFIFLMVKELPSKIFQMIKSLIVLNKLFSTL